MLKEKRVARLYFTEEEVNFLKRVVDEMRSNLPMAEEFEDMSFGQYMALIENINEELNTKGRWSYP